MKEFMGMILCLSIIIGSIWGSIILFSMLVEYAASMGVPAALLYFASGVVAGLWYKDIGSAFMSFSDLVFQKIHDWIIWR